MKTYNLRAAAMTLAAARAVRCVKFKIWSEGRKLSEFAASDLRSAAAGHLAEHPEIVERASKDVEAWRAKFKTSAQRKRR